MLPADEKAVLRLVSWMAQADGLVAPEEHDLLEHLVAGRLLARGWAADPEAAASLLCATPVQLEELPALVQQLATPQQRRRVSLLARHMLQVHRAPGETEEGQACEREALDQLLRVLEPPPAGSTSAAVIDHQLRGTLGGPMLPPRPESVVRLHSDRQLQLHTPAGFCPQRMRWETPIGPLPAFLGELGLLGGQRHTAFYGYAPQWTQPRCGLLLLPGGRVDFRAYAAVARELACHELVVVVQNVPFGFALLDHDRALGPQGPLRRAFPGVRHWFVGGHSLGGVAAACYARRHPQDVEGLVLWASYPSATHSLADQRLPVASLCGSDDGLVAPQRVQAMRHLLPANARLVELDGANHTQFGDYWDGCNHGYVQNGDRPASLSRSEQRHQVVRHTLRFLQQAH